MKKNFKFITKYLKQHRIKLIIACSLVFIASLFNLTYGYFNVKAIEEITKLNTNKATLMGGIFYDNQLFSISIICYIKPAVRCQPPIRMIPNVVSFIFIVYNPLSRPR